jgi:hypothetical protein
MTAPQSIADRLPALPAMIVRHPDRVDCGVDTDWAVVPACPTPAGGHTSDGLMQWLPPRLAVAALSAFIAVAVASPVSATGAEHGSPAAVIDTYESARNRGDMNTVVALFADDAVVVDEAGTLHRGRQTIRLLLQPGINPDWAASITDLTVIQDYVFWTERVGVHGTARTLSVTAIVRDGSIKVLAYGGAQSSPTVSSSTEAAPVLPAAVGLVGVLLAAIGSLGIITVSRVRPAHTPLRGSLFAQLRQWSEGRSPRTLGMNMRTDATDPSSYEITDTAAALARSARGHDGPATARLSVQLHPPVRGWSHSSGLSHAGQYSQLLAKRSRAQRT